MGVIFRLALRNLTEHKSKTIIIALFLIFGIAIVIMGNSFLESINRGLEKDFRAHYTGDIAIHKKTDKSLIIDIFGATPTTITGDLPQIPALPELERVEQIVSETPNIAQTTRQISAQVLVAYGLEMDLSHLSERDDLGFDDLPISMLFGVDQDTYWDVFPGLNFIEGRYPAPDTNEIIVDTRVKNAFESLYERKLSIGDTLLVMGANTNGVVREAKVVGVFNPPDENSAMFQIIYCNASLARSFADLTYGANFVSDLPDSIDLSLGTLSEDDMFGGESSFEDFSFDDVSFSDDPFGGDIFGDGDLFSFDDADDGFELLTETEIDYNAILGDTTLRDELNKTDDGAWNFIIIKTERAGQTEKTIAALNERFEEEGLNVKAINWKDAAMSYTETVEGLGFIFNLLIIILAIVVFIIIMNTMTVSVIERTGEIGTMRAIGAEKKFVRRLFFTETLCLTSVSSVIGIVFAFICMGIFNSLNITITNSIAKMILGGGLMHFSPTFAIIGISVAVALVGSILSNLYPVGSALKITPLKALSKSDS